MSRKAELSENILASKLESALTWIIERRVQVLTSFGVAIAAVLIGSVFALRRHDAREQARTRVAYSQALLSQARFAEAASALDDVRKNPVDADTARLAAYLRGVAALGMSKPDDAVTYLNEAVALSNGHPLQPLALADLGAAYEQKKDFDSAARTYQTFLTDHADHFMSARVMLSLGRVQYLTGKPDDAKKTLDRLVDLHPTSEWAENARRLIDKNKIR
jgi:TolA-binding protein